MFTDLTPVKETPQKIQPVGRNGVLPKNTSEASPDSPFETVMRAVLSPNSDNTVSEEELFAALIQERISTLKGEDALKKYQELLEAEKIRRTKANGYIPMEASARSALRKMVKEGMLTVEEGDQIHTQAFNSAQLDDDRDNLFDGIGDENDPTRSVADMESALAGARTLIEEYVSGLTTAVLKPLKDRYYANGRHTGGVGIVNNSIDITSSNDNSSHGTTTKDPMPL